MASSLLRLAAVTTNRRTLRSTGLLARSSLQPLSYPPEIKFQNVRRREKIPACLDFLIDGWMDGWMDGSIDAVELMFSHVLTYPFPLSRQIRTMSTDPAKYLCGAYWCCTLCSTQDPLWIAFSLSPNSIIHLKPLLISRSPRLLQDQTRNRTSL
jgi:hypothetical protein